MVFQNDNPHKLSQAELLHRKMNAKSKNEVSAKQELEKKYQNLREGKLTKEYKEIVSKPKKYTAN